MLNEAVPRIFETTHSTSRWIECQMRRVDRSDRRSNDEVGQYVAFDERPDRAHLECAQGSSARENKGDPVATPLTKPLEPLHPRDREARPCHPGERSVTTCWDHALSVIQTNGAP